MSTFSMDQAFAVYRSFRPLCSQKLCTLMVVVIGVCCMYLLYSNILVLRVGGQTADVTVVAVNSGMYRVCGNVTVPDLGGSIIDNLLVEHFAAEFQRFAVAL